MQVQDSVPETFTLSGDYENRVLEALRVAPATRSPGWKTPPRTIRRTPRNPERLSANVRLGVR
jgi:hypothetical protein